MNREHLELMDSEDERTSEMTSYSDTDYYSISNQSEIDEIIKNSAENCRIIIVDPNYASFEKHGSINISNASLSKNVSQNQTHF